MAVFQTPQENYFAEEAFRMPEAPKLSDLIAPEVPGRAYIGPNINWSNLPSAISSLLTLLDPSGMLSGPAGLVWLERLATPGWLKSGILGGPPKLEKAKKMGELLESKFPMVGKAAKETPVRLVEKLPQSQRGLYSEAKGKLPQGLITLSEEFAPTTVPHEAFHRFQDYLKASGDASLARLQREFLHSLPSEKRFSLLKEVGPRVEEELPAYLFARQFGDWGTWSPNIGPSPFIEILFDYLKAK